MPNANLILNLTYTPPASAQNSGIASIPVSITFDAQSVGVLDIPTSTPAGTIFQIPFGSIAGAQLVMVRNLTSNAIGLKINGDGADMVTSPNATILSSLVTLANELKSRYNSHIANTNGAFHAINDTTNVVTSANATDLASSITLLNEMKGDYNAHIANTGGSYHAVVDTANVVTSANGTDLPTAVVLANEMKGDFNNHRTQTIHYGIDLCRMESGGVWSYFQPTIPTLNALSSASISILTPPTTQTETIQYWCFGT